MPVTIDLWAIIPVAATVLAGIITCTWKVFNEIGKRKKIEYDFTNIKASFKKEFDSIDKKLYSFSELVDKLSDKINQIAVVDISDSKEFEHIYNDVEGLKGNVSEIKAEQTGIVANVAGLKDKIETIESYMKDNLKDLKDGQKNITAILNQVLLGDKHETT